MIDFKIVFVKIKEKLYFFFLLNFFRLNNNIKICKGVINLMYWLRYILKKFCMFYWDYIDDFFVYIFKWVNKVNMF